MSVNTANTPDGRGVLIYNGEVILLYTKHASISFPKSEHVGPAFKGKKSGSVYLTSHRVIFMTKGADPLLSFSMPFHAMKDVRLEQPLLGANYLQGIVTAQSGGNFTGDVVFRLSFSKGGCIDFGQALLRADDLARKYGATWSPPKYSGPANAYHAAPPNYYTAPPGNFYGLQPPTHVFPEKPADGTVFMYEAPPPYGGIGPQGPTYQFGSNPYYQPTPYPQGPLQPGPSYSYPSYPPAGASQQSTYPMPPLPTYPGPPQTQNGTPQPPPPSYDSTMALPQKS